MIAAQGGVKFQCMAELGSILESPVWGC